MILYRRKFHPKPPSACDLQTDQSSCLNFVQQSAGISSPMHSLTQEAAVFAIARQSIDNFTRRYGENNKTISFPKFYLVNFSENRFGQIGQFEWAYTQRQSVGLQVCPWYELRTFQSVGTFSQSYNQSRSAVQPFRGPFQVKFLLFCAFLFDWIGIFYFQATPIPFNIARVCQPKLQRRLLRRQSGAHQICRFLRQIQNPADAISLLPEMQRGDASCQTDSGWTQCQCHTSTCGWRCSCFRRSGIRWSQRPCLLWMPWRPYAKSFVGLNVLSQLQLNYLKYMKEQRKTFIKSIFYYTYFSNLWIKHHIHPVDQAFSSTFFFN